MGWFDEQIRLRTQTDDDAFADAIAGIGDAVMGKHLRDILSQREATGSAIEEILQYCRCKTNNDEMPPELSTLDEQLDFRLRPHGIMRKTVLLDDGWFHNAVGAMLGTLREDGTPVALIPDKFYGYSFSDPHTGRKVKVNAKTQKLLDEEAVCVFLPLPMKKLTVADLLRFTLERLTLSDVLLYVGLTLLGTLLGLLSPMFTKWLFGDVLESGNVTVLLALSSFMLCYSVSRMLFDAYKTLSLERVEIKQNVAVQAAVMSRILSLPASFFRNYSSGELTQRASYVRSLCSMILSSVGTTGLTAAFSLVYIGQILAYAPALVLPSLSVTLVTVGISVVASLMRVRLNKQRMLLSSQTSGMTYSMITGVQKIKLAGAEKRMFSRWAKGYAKEANLAYNEPLFLKLSGTITLGVTLLGNLVIYTLAVKSAVSVSDYYAFNAAFGMIAGALTSLQGIATSFAGIRSTLEMAKPIMEAEPETSEGREIITKLSGSIELSNVSFRYTDDMPNVINDLSLRIKAGEYVAIVGTTGCGKSTLLRLMLGFEKPQKGSIYYDRKDINKVDIKSLRRKIGVVTQDGKLFSGDIYSNIVISAPNLTVDDAWEAARIASVDEDIRAMPMGMHTVIAEGQGGISGGQRQRLMIARAIAPKPKILMFDEATSALDNVTQKKITEAMDTLKCTRIVIAHRLSTIRHSDRIIVLDKGKIAESGTYEELIKKNGIFASLVERQRLDIDTEET